MLPQQSLAEGTIVAGRYRIVRELGRGGMGVIYVVEHTNTGAELAMKLMLDGTQLNADRAARFRREARASARVSSEHVVKVTDADTAPELAGAPFLVMELLNGMDLERRLLERGKLAPKETVTILSQVARALDKAHVAGVVHRDLKPENVFLHRREDGTEIVKVLDFGISKILGRNGDMSAAQFTSSMEVMGTPLYMAPEQARAKHGDVGPWTDVWALALVTMRMLTGGHYWTAETITDLLIQIMSEERTLPSVRFPELGRDLDAWFVKSTAFEPKNRYQTIGEQVNELAMILTGERAVRPTSTAPMADAPKPALGMTMPLSQVPRPASTPPPPGNPMSLSPQVAQPRTSSHAGAVALGSSTAGPMNTTGAGLPKSRAPLAALLGVLFVGAAVGAFLLARPHGTPIATTTPVDTATVSASAPPPAVSSIASAAPMEDPKPVVDASAPVAVVATAIPVTAAPRPVPVGPIVPRPVKSASSAKPPVANNGDPFDTQK